MMLVFDHVCVFYGDTPVLRELSFQIRSGEQVGLIGANGAGKSTLMKAALGLLPYTGSITVDGIPVTRKTLPEVRRKLGYVLQDADNQMFMPTVLDDMVFGPMNYGLSRAAAEQRAEETLAELHMEYLRDRHNHKMSGGEKRMAAVATILAMQPQMLLMDEPSTALDPRNRRTLIRVLRQRPERSSSPRTTSIWCWRPAAACCCLPTGVWPPTARQGRSCVTGRCWRKTGWSCRCVWRACRTGSERGPRPVLLQFPRAYRIMLEAGRKKTENVEMTERIVFLWIVQN